MCQLLAAEDLHRRTAKLLVGTMEPILHLLLGIECLDDTQAAKRFFYLAHQASPLILPFQTLALESFAHLTHQSSGYR